MSILVRYLPIQLSRLLRMRSATGCEPTPRANVFLPERVDNSLPRTLRRDGWWLET